MDSTLILGLAANVIALAAVAAGWRQSRDALVTQRRLADLDNVRDLLDQAAVALHEASYVLDDVRSQITQHSPRFFKTDDGTELYKRLGSGGRAFDALVERLRVRFGRQHSAVEAFARAVEAQLDIYRAAGLVRQEPDFEDSSSSPAARRMKQQFDDEIRTRIETQREAFDQAREDFIDAANTAAGADLGGG